jgi:hypothetical protein
VTTPCCSGSLLRLTMPVARLSSADKGMAQGWRNQGQGAGAERALGQPGAQRDALRSGRPSGESGVVGEEA